MLNQGPRGPRATREGWHLPCLAICQAIMDTSKLVKICQNYYVETRLLYKVLQEHAITERIVVILLILSLVFSVGWYSGRWSDVLKNVGDLLAMNQLNIVNSKCSMFQHFLQFCCSLFHWVGSHAEVSSEENYARNIFLQLGRNIQHWSREERTFMAVSWKGVKIEWFRLVWNLSIN